MTIELIDRRATISVRIVASMVACLMKISRIETISDRSVTSAVCCWLDDAASFVMFCQLFSICILHHLLLSLALILIVSKQIVVHANSVILQ
jgi:hypothetical protein